MPPSANVVERRRAAALVSPRGVLGLKRAVCDAHGVLTKRTRGPAGALTPDFVPCGRLCAVS
jgi:hypothetical protein